MRPVITEQDIPDSGELRVPSGAILTPSARETALQRGVKIVELAKGESPAPLPAERTIAVGCDHGGFELKQKLLPMFLEYGLAVRDIGIHDAKPADYPDVARQVAELVAGNAAARGVIIDGAGIGSAMVANKFAGVRAALCYDRASARNSREHNDANVLTLGGRLLTPTQAEDVLRTWLTTPFGGGRHVARVEKIREIERAQGLRPAVANQVTSQVNTQELDRLAATIGEEVLARAGAAPAPADQREGLNIPDLVCPGCQQRCAQTCAKKSKEILAAGADRLSASDKLTRIDSAIAASIDHTLLRPDATAADIRKICREAKSYNFASVCVNPYWASLVAAELAGSPVKVCTVVGFPLGANTTAIKVAETEAAIRVGAQEIDMVINIGELLGGNYDAVRDDIRAVINAAHQGGAIVKVILETAFLDDNQKAIASTLAKVAGAEFVKTSTGFGPHGATVHDVALMRQVVGADMGVKASGGIRTLEDLKNMAAAGATRIGASASVKIVEATAG